LLVAIQVDQPQTVAWGIFGRPVVPYVAPVVAERQRRRAALHLVQRREKLTGGRSHATRRRGRTIGNAQILDNSSGHGSRLRSRWYYLYFPPTRDRAPGSMERAKRCG